MHACRDFMYNVEKKDGLEVGQGHAAGRDSGTAIRTLYYGLRLIIHGFTQVNYMLTSIRHMHIRQTSAAIC